MRAAANPQKIGDGYAAHVVLVAGCLALALAGMTLPAEFSGAPPDIPLETAPVDLDAPPRPPRIVWTDGPWVYAAGSVRIRGRASIEFRCSPRGLDAHLLWADPAVFDGLSELESVAVPGLSGGAMARAFIERPGPVKWRMIAPGHYRAEKPTDLIYALAMTEAAEAVFVFRGMKTMLGVPLAGFAGSMNSLACLHPALDGGASRI